jgi:hypothetical protein
VARGIERVCESRELFARATNRSRRVVRQPVRTTDHHGRHVGGPQRGTQRIRFWDSISRRFRAVHRRSHRSIVIAVHVHAASSFCVLARTNIEDWADPDRSRRRLKFASSWALWAPVVAFERAQCASRAGIDPTAGVGGRDWRVIHSGLASPLAEAAEAAARGRLLVHSPDRVEKHGLVVDRGADGVEDARATSSTRRARGRAPRRPGAERARRRAKCCPPQVLS